MNIHEALKQISWDKAEYFKWKYPDARFDQRLPIKTEEEFLRVVNKKTINTYLRWEKTQEYKALVALYLQSRTANDLQEIYSVVSDKAKKGDEKAVKLFLTLNKEIQEHAKTANQTFSNEDDDKEDEDDLIV